MKTTLLAALALGLLPVAAGAQAKAGETFVDDTSLGFKIKTPKDWDFYPPKPGDQHMIGRYQGSRVQVSADDVLVEEFYIVKFDARPDAEGKKPSLAYDSIEKFMNAHMEGSWTEVEQRPLKVKGVTGVEYFFFGHTARLAELGAYAAVFDLEEGLRVAVCGNGPGERKWSKYEEGYQRLAKTFQRVEVAAAAKTTGGSVRDQKRQQLADEANRTPGWRLLETPNYFVITNSDDQAFLDELMGRIEAIRAVYEKDYPPSSARIAKQEPATDPGEEGGEGEGEGGEAERTVATKIVDPMELSRTSVVRVCATREAYLGYGAPAGSGGYWSSYHQELVVYNKKMEEGEDATWETLSHEAFHQYIFYFYGSLAPHSWYNEGTGDYYGGHEYTRKKFVRAPRQMRKETAKEVLREGRMVPLQEFVRWTQAQYYGENEYSLPGFDCYAQGWSLVYFLRMGDEVRGFNPAWNAILPTYLEALLDTGDLDAAVDKAFAGVDWDAIESAWKTFIEKQL